MEDFEHDFDSFFEQNKFQEGLDLINSQIKLKPKNAELLQKRGDFQRILGKHLEAIKSYNFSLKIDPSLKSNYFRLGKAYYLLGDLQMSMFYLGLAQAEGNDEDKEKITTLAAKIYLERNDVSSSIDSLEALEAESPENTLDKDQIINYLKDSTTIIFYGHAGAGKSIALNQLRKELLEKGSDTYFEGRVIIVGEGMVGKTTLLKKLKDELIELDPKEPQTHGINIWNDYSFKCDYEGKSQLFRASIWDFGGQDIQYLTHQLFLSPKAVYVLVVNQRDKNTAAEIDQFNYWFRIIDLLGREKGEKAQLIVVHNKRESETSNRKFDLAPYKKAYDQGIEVSEHEVNLGNIDFRFFQLKEDIEETLLKLPLVGEKIISGWNEVRDSLRAVKSKKRINFDEYATICSGHGISTEESQRILSKHLHNLGEILHYQGETGLDDWVFLDIQWVTEAIYAILFDQNIIDSYGRFSKNQVLDVLKQKGITSARDRNLMFTLLQIDAFELCMPAPDSKNKIYLAPQLFNSLEPRDLPQFRPTMQLRYSYTKVMPKGLLSRLIVRLHEYIDGDKFWRYGVYLRSYNKSALAKIVRPLTGENPGNSIKIEISGPKLEVYSLLNRIKCEIDSIHDVFFPGIPHVLDVPCTCDSCLLDENPHFFQYNLLRDWFLSGDEDTRCGVSNKKVNIKILLEGVDEAFEETKTKRLTNYILGLVASNDIREAINEAKLLIATEDWALLNRRLCEWENNSISGAFHNDEMRIERAAISKDLLLLISNLH